MNSLTLAPQIKPKIYKFRNPTAEDGATVNRLIASCPPLDSNSIYCNLLQCSYFSETSIIAEDNSRIVGFISGFIVPKREDTMFIWQVAVEESAREQGLALRMLLKLLQRPACHTVRYLETTITDNNTASKALFTKLADQLGVELIDTKHFMRDIHFNNQHDDEYLFRMGPFNTSLLTFTNI